MKEYIAFQLSLTGSGYQNKKQLAFVALIEFSNLYLIP